MANIVTPKEIPPKLIKKFLGLNENQDGGEYGLKLGEASSMLNFRITSNYQLKKREGYWEKFELTINSPEWSHAVWGTDSWICESPVVGGKVMGMWYGKLNNTNYFLFCHAGHLYSGNLTDGTKTDLGTLADAPTRFIAFGSKVYINNGVEYKSFDGVVATPSTDSIQTVTGYVPKAAIGAPPSGGGTDYEQINVLTGEKHMTFTPNGSDTAYHLRETGIDSVDYVKVFESGAWVTKNYITHYTVDLTNGIVNFITAPSGSVPDTIDIGWTKGNGTRSYIEGCRFSMDYSGQTDSRVFMWGNTELKNRRFWSGLADGVPSAEYFEANSYDDLGSGQYAITDIVKQYDRQKIYLEDRVMYSYYDLQTIDGVDYASFPVFELNEEVGNVAFGQVQVVNNSPFSISSGIRKWDSSTVRDQTNEKLISDRVQDSLLAKDLTNAITVNWKYNKEYWLNIDDIVWVYNYVNDTWYKFDNITATCFLVVNDELYFGADGYIYKFDKTKRSDNGTEIEATWEMGFYDFDAEWLTKYMNNIWISLSPDDRSTVDIQTVTNNEGNGLTQNVKYNHFTFANLDFTDLSFNTSYNPQPVYLEIQAMGFCYFKIVLDSNSLTETVTVLSINMPARFGGKVR